jgi:hypothetical protein
VYVKIDVVKEEEIVEGKPIPEQLPLGTDILGNVRIKYTKYLAGCDGRETRL